MGQAALAGAATGMPGATRARSRRGTPIFALRNPGCMCCIGWADHLREHGFEVHLHDSPDLQAVKERLGIPEDLEGCHTAMVEGYIVEGHVPAGFIERMLEEKPQVAGIAVPGMPVGSPGMEGPNPQPFDIIAYGGAAARERYVFGTFTPGAGVG
ncbi:MAG: DUF411 domain-containing protein [Gemmatimonadetes bacterium]|nr:DUF411 domain-containing protein [Gemmatimonadota bacterium]